MIKNKKILIVLSPDLDKCSEDLQLLCNIQFSMLKAISNYILGEQIQTKNEAEKQNNNTWIFLNSDIDYIPNGCTMLPAQLSSLNMSLFVFETKYPQTQEGKSFYYQLNHHFYFKGYHPHLDNKLQKITPKLQKNHYIYKYKEHILFLGI